MKQIESFLTDQSFLKLTRLIAASSFIITLIVLIWATNKSFDFTDESFYAIGYYFNLDIDNTVIFFHKIYNFFFGFLNFTLLQNRLLAIILTLACSLTLAYNSLLYFNLKDKFLLLTTTSTIGFLGYFIYPMALSYNSIGALLIMLIISATLNYLNKRKKVMLFLIGFLATLIVLNKFTNLLFLVLGLIGVLFFNYKEFKFSKKGLALSTGILVIGTLFPLLILFPSIKELKELINGFFYGLSLSTSHDLGEMISRFNNELLRLLSFSIYLIPIITLLMLLTFSKKALFLKHQSLIISITIILTFLFLEYSTHGFTGPYNVSVFYYLIFLTSLSLILFYNKKIKAKKEFLFGLVFIVTPFIISLGTNNSLFIHFTFNGGVFGLGLFLIISNIPNNRLKYLLIIITVLTASFQISYNKINNPYRSEALTFQTEEITNIPYLKGIKTTPEIATTINELKELKNHPAKKVFLCSHQLGVSLVLDKQPLFFSWIDKSSYHLISDYLENKKEELDQSILFFIPSNKEEKATIISELSTSKQLNFLSNYRYMKSIKINETFLDIYGLKNIEIRNDAILK